MNWPIQVWQDKVALDIIRSVVYGGAVLEGMGWRPVSRGGPFENDTGWYSYWWRWGYTT